MAHTKAKGTSKLGRDSIAKRLGVKVYGGQKIRTGMIIIRQRGSKYHLGDNVALGKDDTIFSLINGVVKFSESKRLRFDNKLIRTTFVSVVPLEKTKKDQTEKK